MDNLAAFVIFFGILILYSFYRLLLENPRLRRGFSIFIGISVTVVVAFTIGQRMSHDNQERQTLRKIDEQISLGNREYDANQYPAALGHFLTAIELGSKNAIVWYRTAYSLRTIEGDTRATQFAYLMAVNLLRYQNPESDYYRYASQQVEKYQNLPVFRGSVAENRDVYGIDNDGDGRIETTFVRGYFRSDGTYVRSHYRAQSR